MITEARFFFNPNNLGKLTVSGFDVIVWVILWVIVWRNTFYKKFPSRKKCTIPPA